MPGLFVTLEGGEGSGKSTLLAALSGRLGRAGIAHDCAREPGGTSLAEGIRGLLLDPEHPPVPIAEAFLLEAARAQLVATFIRPRLAEGRVILCDRYADSTLAYQGGGRGLDLPALRVLNEVATLGLQPHLTLLLDLPVDEGLRRRHAAAGALNRLDLEPHPFHERVRRVYLDLAAAEPGRFVVLDAARPAAEIEAGAWAALEGRLATAGLLAPGR